MGIGNITELTAADTTGVNAMLIAICQEIGVRAVLTTEVMPWAHGAVREIDIARRLAHYAVTQRQLPKHVDDRLVTIKDPSILAYSEADLRALQASITDANFRIFIDREAITVLNCERFVRGTDIPEISASSGSPSRPRVLPRPGARQGQTGHHARQDVPPGRVSRLGISDTAR